MSSTDKIAKLIRKMVKLQDQKPLKKGTKQHSIVKHSPSKEKNAQNLTSIKSLKSLTPSPKKTRLKLKKSKMSSNNLAVTINVAIKAKRLIKKIRKAGKSKQNLSKKETI